MNRIIKHNRIKACVARLNILIYMSFNFFYFLSLFIVDDFYFFYLLTYIILDLFYYMHVYKILFTLRNFLCTKTHKIYIYNFFRKKEFNSQQSAC
jgi:hypothetical protein